MRVLLDGVFNHSSPNFFAFKNLQARGAASPYRDWYYPLAYPIQVAEGQRTYRTFAGVANMPKLNQANPPTRDYFVGIGAKWVREAGVDGWRLDVADEIDPAFLRAFRRGVRAARRDAYLAGETWGDAHAMIQGDAMDASMNYRWRDATLKLVNRQITPAEYVRLLQEIDATTPVAARGATFNVLGSHDTERLRTVLGGSESKHRLAAAIQFFSPGVPVIYYGDEYGLEGRKEPASRNAFPLKPTAAQSQLAAYYRSLAQMRRGFGQATSCTVSITRAGGLKLTRRDARGKAKAFLLINLADTLMKVKRAGELMSRHEASVAGSEIKLKPSGFIIYRPASRIP